MYGLRSLQEDGLPSTTSQIVQKPTSIRRKDNRTKRGGTPKVKTFEAAILTDGYITDDGYITLPLERQGNAGLEILS